jgi:putative hydrolase of the HAD superfamily
MDYKCGAIIFDLGKVVFDLSFDRVFYFWASHTDRQFSDIKGKFQFDSLFDEFEKGTISANQFRSEVSNRLGLALTDEVFDKGWCDLYLDKYNNIDNLLANLKQNYRIVALTNTNIIHETTWRIKYKDTLRHFEKIFCSHELMTRKPERRAYQIVLDYLDMNPQQTIFLDDNVDNIAGASELGIPTILVTSPQQMRDELKTKELIDINMD